MEKQKPWQLILIIAVIGLTIYNVLPTVFYYSQPLSQSIEKVQADSVSQRVKSRLENLEKETLDYLKAFCKNLKIKPTQIKVLDNDPGLINIHFPNEQQVETFKKYFSHANKKIPFSSAQLSLISQSELPKEIYLKRSIETRLNDKNLNHYFSYFPKQDKDNQLSKPYRNSVFSRLSQLCLNTAGESPVAEKIRLLNTNETESLPLSLLLEIAENIVDIPKVFGLSSPLTQRYFSSFSQTAYKDKKQAIEGLAQKFLNSQKKLIEEEEILKKKKENQDSLSDDIELNLIQKNIQLLQEAHANLQKNKNTFLQGTLPLKEDTIPVDLEKKFQDLDSLSQLQIFDLKGRNPFIAKLSIDWQKDKILLVLHDDLNALLDSENDSETRSLQRDKLTYLLYDEITRIQRASNESVTIDGSNYSIRLHNLEGAQSFLSLELSQLAKDKVNSFKERLNKFWSPTHPDFQVKNFPIWTYETFSKLSKQDKQLGLLIYSPYEASSPDMRENFNKGSIYIIVKGIQKVINKIQAFPEARQNQSFLQDWGTLRNLLQEEGFTVSYLGHDYLSASEFSDDIIFRLDNFYSNFIYATREHFQTYGHKQQSVLEFTDKEQRIITENAIDNQIHEELLTWKENYQKAQVNLNHEAKKLVPPPIKSVIWENIKLTLKKYLRGDDRKVLRWGLDLSGGKTVRIGLKDENNQTVTNETDLAQARSELYKRVNKMGVSEVSIRSEGSNIILDFPSSQNFSAGELIKASAMYFHIVNEKFSPDQLQLGQSVNSFLQGVWNEAVVTNRKDLESIQEIAWRQLTGGKDEDDTSPVQPQTKQAKILYENGLRLSSPQKYKMTSALDESLSTIAMYNSSDSSNWPQGSHPLMIVFNNYVLEGSSLENVQAAFNSQEGDYLSFGVKAYYSKENRQGSPRDDFYNWTSQFSRENVKNTPKGKISHSRGWRMAVILNGSIVSVAELRSPLRNYAQITGNFSKREVNQLAADLKAGSLSYKPKILSETNVSPELGKAEKSKGILASIVGLAGVVLMMLMYYRFAGLVASVAIIFNLLIIWGVLQNLHAVLTLPGIAGIILTIGMAVDANVLVFERIKEEFKNSGKLASAIHAGYKKAFSAIIDSNITTMIAALILLQFDSGPIKGFAVTLLIGIASSMFTALFMTRYFFIGWVKNPKHQTLSIAEIIENTKVKFVEKTPYFITLFLVVTLAGSALMFVQKSSILGMDFVGGYALNIDLLEQKDLNYRQAVEKALISQGADPSDLQIRSLNRLNHLHIQLGMGMELQGRPFYQLPNEVEISKNQHDYESNPRLTWLVKSLEKSKINLRPSSLENLDQNWSRMSGQLSNTMRNQALISLSLALLSILIYITIRFEFKYAISSIIALAHDLIITSSLLAMLHSMGLGIQIDMQVIGALMTIIGYSLNDTIIVFDRIREDLRLMKKYRFKDIVNHAINETLSRTLMTSGTTLVVLLTLVLFAGPTIFDFSLVMTIGVIVGTFSSLFIAPALLIYFHDKELANEQLNTVKAKKA